MIPTNGLNHLALPVKDPEQSAQFYADLFNMEITSSSPEIAFLKTVGSTDMLTLNRSQAAIASGKEALHFGFIVTPDQFDAALRTIKEKSVEKVLELSKRSIGRYIFIEDPDGYVVEIFERLSPL